MGQFRPAIHFTPQVEETRNHIQSKEILHKRVEEKRTYRLMSGSQLIRGGLLSSFENQTNKKKPRNEKLSVNSSDQVKNDFKESEKREFKDQAKTSEMNPAQNVETKAAKNSNEKGEIYSDGVKTSEEEYEKQTPPLKNLYSEVDQENSNVHQKKCQDQQSAELFSESDQNLPKENITSKIQQMNEEKNTDKPSEAKKFSFSDIQAEMVTDAQAHDIQTDENKNKPEMKQFDMNNFGSLDNIPADIDKEHIHPANQDVVPGKTQQVENQVIDLSGKLIDSTSVEMEKTLLSKVKYVEPVVSQEKLSEILKDGDLNEEKDQIGDSNTAIEQNKSQPSPNSFPEKKVIGTSNEQNHEIVETSNTEKSTDSVESAQIKSQKGGSLPSNFDSHLIDKLVDRQKEVVDALDAALRRKPSSRDIDILSAVDQPLAVSNTSKNQPEPVVKRNVSLTAMKTSSDGKIARKMEKTPASFKNIRPHGSSDCHFYQRAVLTKYLSQKDSSIKDIDSILRSDSEYKQNNFPGFNFQFESDSESTRNSLNLSKKVTKTNKIDSPECQDLSEKDPQAIRTAHFDPLVNPQTANEPTISLEQYVSKLRSPDFNSHEQIKLINQIFQDFKELQLVYQTIEMLTDSGFVKKRFTTNLIRDKVLRQLCLIVTRKIRFKSAYLSNFNLLVWPVCVWLYDEGILTKCDSKAVLEAILKRITKSEELNVSGPKQLFEQEEFKVLNSLEDLKGEKSIESVKVVFVIPKENERVEMFIIKGKKRLDLKTILIKKYEKYEFVNHLDNFNDRREKAVLLCYEWAG